jgi:hypothetical protein
VDFHRPLQDELVVCAQNQTLTCLANFQGRSATTIIGGDDRQVELYLNYALAIIAEK